MKRLWLTIAAALFTLLGSTRLDAAFHAVVFDEVVTSYGGDPDVQFIEMRMTFPFQNLTTHSIFAAFDDTGTYIGDILEVPSDLPNQGNGVRWLVGTSEFQTTSALAPDFIMPPGILPTAGGMVCYGGGQSQLLPEDPPDWDRNDFTNYVDCLAYGTYAGTTNSLITAPTPLDGDGHSLQRVGNTYNNLNDFACGDPITPQNNNAASASLPATTFCGACPGQFDPACLTGFAKGFLLVKEAPAGKEKLVAKLLKGPALVQNDLGNPLSSGGTAYGLCVYDDSGSLAGEFEVDRAGDSCAGLPCWSAIGDDPPDGKGYKYKDEAGGADGVRKVLYKSGEAGKSKVIMKGKGPGLPSGVAAALQSATSVRLQFRGSDAAECLSVDLTDFKKQESDFFKAK